MLQNKNIKKQLEIKLETLKNGFIDAEVIWALDQLIHLDIKCDSELLSLLTELEKASTALQKGNDGSHEIPARIHQLHKKMEGSSWILNALKQISMNLVLAICILVSIPLGIVTSPVLIILGIRKSIIKYRNNPKGMRYFAHLIYDSIKYGLLASIAVSALVASMIDRHAVSRHTR